MTSFDWLRLLVDGFLAAFVFVYFMLPIERKRSGFCILLSLEIIYRIIAEGLVLNRTLELEQYRVVVYLLYITLKLLWFQVYVKDALENFYKSYLVVSISCYSCGGIFSFLAIKYPFFSMLYLNWPRTWQAFAARIFGSILTIWLSALLYRTKWMQKIKDEILESIFLISLLVGEVITTLLYVEQSYSSIILFTCVCIQFVTVWLGIRYAYLRTKRRQLRLENRALQKAIQAEYLYYEKLCKQEMEYKKIKHDLANHLQVISGLKTKQGIDASEKYKEKIYHSYLKLEELEKDLAIESAEHPAMGNIKQFAKVLITPKWFIIIVTVAIFFLTVLLQLKRHGLIGTWEITIWVIVVNVIFFLIAILLIQFEKRKKVILKSQSSDTIGMKEDKTILKDVYKLSQELHTMSTEDEQSLFEHISKYSHKVITGIAPLDIMLNQKIQACDEIEVQIDCQLDFLSTCAVNPADLIGLIGNLLDNATEACLRCSGERNIVINGTMRANILVLKVENSKLKEEKPVETGFGTVKQDAQEHGYGMKIIQSIVDKYEGQVEYTDKGELFRTVVSLFVNVNARQGKNS